VLLMRSVLEVLGLGIVLFVSTNVDDIFVLVGFFADPKVRSTSVVIGQYVGIGILFVGSVIVCLLSVIIPRVYIGLLGVGPIAIGAKWLFDLRRGSNKVSERYEPRRSIRDHGQSLTVSLVTLANGGDNIGVYIPVFAVRSGHEIAMIGLVFVAMTALWCYLAHGIVHHHQLGGLIRRYGRHLAPLVLIGLGIMIMHEAGSFAFLLQRGGF
jgi:cadmium resistance protein CadD (predicted permease)